MTEFERLLAAYRGGRVDLETLQASVETLVGESNRAATGALMVLETATMWPGLYNDAGIADREFQKREMLRGRAYDDPLTKCGPEHDEAHSGETDSLIGFRLVRELG